MQPVSRSLGYERLLALKDPRRRQEQRSKNVGTRMIRNLVDPKHERLWKLRSPEHE